MKTVTKKWLFLKISSVILIPLMIWFIINLVSIYYKSYLEIGNLLHVNYSSKSPEKIGSFKIEICKKKYFELLNSEFQDFKRHCSNFFQEMHA